MPSDINSSSSRAGILLIGITVLLSACQTVQNISPQSRSYLLQNSMSEYVDMNSGIQSDSLFNALIRPYREELSQKMGRVIGRLESNLIKKKPEGTLGNFAADAVKVEASIFARQNIDIAIVNNGGLRVNLYQGNIIVNDIYELMPFENSIVIGELSGYEIIDLLNDIAAIGGEPVSGVRFRIANGKAKDIMLGHKPIVANQIYTIATSDYLANGGGDMPTLWKLKNVIATELKVRDAFIYYIEDRFDIKPFTDGRVR